MHKASIDGPTPKPTHNQYPEDQSIRQRQSQQSMVDLKEVLSWEGNDTSDWTEHWLGVPTEKAHSPRSVLDLDIWQETDNQMTSME